MSAIASLSTLTGSSKRGAFLDTLADELAVYNNPQAIRRLVPHPGQAEIRASDAKYKVVACGRRFGKTQFGIDEIVETALAGYPAAYFAPTHKQALKVWAEFKSILEPVIAEKKDAERTLFLTTGGMVQLWSFHNMSGETARGQAYKKVVIDEAALARTIDLWTRIISPMLADYDGDALFLSTPRGRLNWLHTVFQYENDPEFEGWKSFQMPTSRNTTIPNLSRFLAREKKQKTAGEYGQEYDARFTIVAGAVYPDFNEIDNVTLDADFVPGYPVYWSVDDGYTNPRPIGLWQERPMYGIKGCLVLFDMRHETQELAEYAISETLALGYPSPELVYYDPAAPEFAGNCTSAGLPTWGAYNNVLEGIKVVRRFVRNGEGVRRFFIHPRCQPAIDGMIGYHNPEQPRVASSGGDPNPVKEDDHAVDMIRYFIATRHLYD